ncbi:MAG: glycosyltransferase family 39 protein [Candidatus Sumerlaeia bacterium]|nr:glycosyltransferase family 39 protein [Candidatus Sumerlaeia bacterium]
MTPSSAAKLESPPSDRQGGSDAARFRRWLAAALALSALAAALWTAAHHQRVPGLVQFDAVGYWRAAENLRLHGVFSEIPPPDLLPSSMRTPGYPAVLALAFALFGSDPFVAVGLNALLALGAGLFAGLAARELGAGPRRAAVAAAFVAAHPLTLQWVLYVYTDVLFLCGVCAALWLGFRAGLGGRTGRGPLLMGCAVAGLLPLVRPVGLYLLPLAGLAVAGIAWRGRLSPRWAAAALLVLALPALAWTARNRVVLGSFHFCEIGAWNLRFEHANRVRAEAEGVDFWTVYIAEFKEHYHLISRPSREAPPGPLADRWTSEALGIFAGHPAATLRVTLRSLAALYAPALRDYGPWVGAAYPGTGAMLSGGGALDRAAWKGLLLGLAEQALLFAVLWLAIARGWRALGERDARLLLPLAAAGLLTGLSLWAGGNTGPRFRLPIWPLLVVVALAPAAPRRAP